MSRPIGDRPFEQMIAHKGYKSVAEFGEACGIKPQQIFNHVRGKFKPSIEAIFTYANVLKLPFDEVLKVWYADDLRQNEDIVWYNLGDK